MLAHGPTVAWNSLTRRSTTDEDLRHHYLRLHFLTLLILAEHLVFLEGARLVRDACRNQKRSSGDR